jgi:hypothetical protein
MQINPNIQIKPERLYLLLLVKGMCDVRDKGVVYPTLKMILDEQKTLGATMHWHMHHTKNPTQDQ